MEALTLSVQEVAHWDTVITLVVVDGGILEHLINVRLRSNTHVLLAEVLDVGVDVGASQLFGQGDLLQRHLVDASAHRAQQRRCGEKCTLHGCDSCD